MARKPKDQHLPEMEDVKIPALSKTCRSLSEVREQANELKQTEKGLMATALHQMQTKLPDGQTTYKDHGVELVLVHTDKVRVRLIDDDEGDHGPEAEKFVE